MVPVARVHPEKAGRGVMALHACCGRNGKLQLPVFIGAEPLLGNIYKNIFLMALCRQIFGRHRRISPDIGHVFRYLDGHPRINMASVDPVESRHINPVFAEHLLQGVLGADESRLPWD